MKKTAFLSLFLALVLMLGSTALAVPSLIGTSYTPLGNDYYTSPGKYYFVTQDDITYFGVNTKEIAGINCTVKIETTGDLDALGAIFAADNTVFFDSGTYTFTGQYLFNKTNLSLIGLSGVTFKKNSASDYGVHITVEDVMIQNITFDADGEIFQYYFKITAGADGLLLDGVTVKNLTKTPSYPPNPAVRNVALDINGVSNIEINNFTAEDVQTYAALGCIQIAASNNVAFSGYTNLNPLPSYPNNIIIQMHNNVPNNGVKFYGSINTTGIVIDSYEHTGIILPLAYRAAVCFPTTSTVAMIIGTSANFSTADKNAFDNILPAASQYAAVLDLNDKMWIAADGLLNTTPTVNKAIEDIEKIIADVVGVDPTIPGRDIKAVFPNSSVGLAATLPAGPNAYNIYAVTAGTNSPSGYVPIDVNNFTVDAKGNAVTLRNFNFLPYTADGVLQKVTGATSKNLVDCLTYVPTTTTSSSGIHWYPPDPKSSPAPTNDVPYAAVTGIGSGETRAKIPVYISSKLSGKKAGTLAKGDEFNILSVLGKAARIETNGYEGYVALSKINAAFSAHPLAMTTRKATVYEEPSAKSKYKIGTIAKNTEITVIAWAGAWAQIRFENADGEEVEAWIQVKDIKFVV